ncbi:MAG: DUF169 domain-containing protein [Deltaproteobacteria bacterium]|nr:DUF169 domain-containing protein [Deltaproteobacteria bacterium]
MMHLAEIEEAMSIYIRHQSHPVAIQMLADEDGIPGDAKKPLKDFGVPFSLCQALALSRKEGLTIVLDRESQSCPIALSGLGFVRPEAFLSGQHVLAPVNQSPEARKQAVASLPRFPFGKYRHILISPLKTARFEPDVIVFYGSGAQVMRMIQAAVFSSGEALNSTSTGSGGCLLPIVSPVLEGRCKFAVPGNGDRRLGLVADGELSFGMPRNLFEEVIKGLKLSHDGKQTYPISPGYLKLEYQLPPTYGALRKALLENSK